jgi:putative DNA primase/helicase
MMLLGASEMDALKFAAWYQAFSPPWRVFPLWPIKGKRCGCGKPCNDAGKHPRLSGWPERSRNLAEMRQWFRAHPDSGIGLATGSGLLVVDGDLRNGGVEWVMEQVTYCPKTVTSVTGSGGLHLFYSYPAHLNIRNRVNLVPGVDIRANGGYVVLPPSPHISGKRYAWVQGQGPHEHVITPAPQALLDLLRDPEPPVSKPGNGHTDLGGLEHWARRGKPEGQRNQGLNWLAWTLQKQQADLDQAWRIMCLFADSCNPPMPTAEVAKFYRRLQGNRL